MTRIGDARRREILTAARDCFGRKGFHQTTIADVCVAAGLSPGSVYRYFRSKDDIIKAMVEEERRAAAALVASLVDAPDLLAGLRALFRDALGAFADPAATARQAEVTAEALRNPAVAAVVRAADAATLATLADAIRRAQKAKAIDRSLDPAVTAELLVALLDGLWWRQAITPDADPRRHAAPVAVLLGRLLTPKP